MTTDSITVVIPYFQRQAGILRRALSSIAAQQDCPLPIHVLVVDDASPISAQDEVATVSWRENQQCQVIARPNGGPAAARNTALDHAPSTTRFVAFLDSDDEWHPAHLRRAVSALNAGYGLYFSDHYQLGQTVGAFERGGRIDVSRHAPLTGLEAGLHAYQGDLFDQILRGNVIGTSTVVYDFRQRPELRFRAEFTHAGEDYLFWMDLVKLGAQAAFSSQVEVTYGRGVNVYAGSGWGTDAFARRVYNELRYRRTLRDSFTLTAEQAKHVHHEIDSLRLAFAQDLIHRLGKRKPVSLSLLAAHSKLDPSSLASVPRVIWRRLLGRGKG